MDTGTKGNNQHSGLSREERLWSKIDVRGPEDCWLWLGAIDGSGYGQIGWGQRSKTIKVHQAVVLLDGRTIPAGMVPDHTCHNTDPDCPGGKTCPHRRCCNPRHIEVVTQSENQLRSPRRRAGRASPTCVNGHPWSANEQRQLQGDTFV